MKIKLFGVNGMEFVLLKVLRSPFNRYDEGDKGGSKDKKLMEKLLKKDRDSHSKFMRFITCQYSVTSNMYFWKQFDTYKHGNDVMSESSMNLLRQRDLTEEDFEDISPDQLSYINNLRQSGLFREAGLAMPMSFLQTRHIQSSFQALRNIFKDRKHHRLDEWKEFCDFIVSLPYSDLITVGEV